MEIGFLRIRNVLLAVEIVNLWLFGNLAVVYLIIPDTTLSRKWKNEKDDEIPTQYCMREII